MNISVENKCEACARGVPFGFVRMAPVHSKRGFDIRAPAPLTICDNYDDEWRHAAEPLGFYAFAFLPRICRNGKIRWFRWVERHDDGSYTLGDRAH